MASGSIICNLSMKASDAAGLLYINESLAKTITLNAANPNVSQFTLLVPTDAAGTALVLGSVTTNGVAWLQNMATENYVEVGVDDGGGNFLPLIRLNAGEAWPIRVSQGVTPLARANTAPVVLKCPIMDD